ncbi:kinesin-like protein KIF26B [Dasypus novemcinctus]|uniref:kinesin-like protein KIF26B n=1 Tax=Dasypus novemcinctus TaxID=9361 RepID=UPI00265E2D06|nr:kinesin-like protein KIF26B [Dasypus novemcinctus]
MNSVAGTKERLAVSPRGKKYAVTDVCSPPKPAAPFSAESWFRQACEDPRAGGRPPPEGAGSALGSSGTPSPGSGTSSPGSFAGSPGPASPGIGTSSPGSLGGSPGFGTGSPGSGSGGGSSPGSDRGAWCENCSGRLAELKRQALRLLLPRPGPGKDPAFSAVVHDKLQVPNANRKAWNDRDNRCDVCATHLNRLKQEAIQMVLALEQAAGGEQDDAAPGSPPPLAAIPTPAGARQGGALQQPRDWAFVPAPCAAFVTSKHSGKPNGLGVSNGAEKKGGSPPAKASAQATACPSHGAVLSSVAIQAHQYLDGSWSLSRTNGVTLYPYQISPLMPEPAREGPTDVALARCPADQPLACSTPASQPGEASEPPAGTSVAASFFARAAQKLNLSSRKKKHRPSPASAAEPPLFATSFSGILQSCPPPAPPCLLRAVTKAKDSPGLGKVKVMLRVCSALARGASEPSSFLKVDPRKKQITLYDPLACGGQSAFQKRGGQVPPKMFAFDAVFPQDASQAEVCAGTVAEVIQSVVNGADGCVFCFGHAKLGKSYTMIGKDDATQSLGIIPCSISWLFRLINERKERTGARFSVRISAVEVWGKEENLRDLLSEVATGSLQDGQSPGVYLCEDPICGMQLQNQSELRAPTAEKAAFFLDAAIASRRSRQQACDEDDQRNSHMLFTLHIYQYRMEKSGKGGMSGGRSRLHLIDLGSCVKALSKNREGGPGLCLSLSALGNVILALVNGSKHIPYKDSKLTMLLRESLGNVNCRTTMIAHVSAAAGSYAETLSTVQIAARVLRMKKKKTKHTSSSSGGESSCEEGRMRRPTQLRPFHARSAVDPDFPLPHLSSDPDYSSSSEQSCDTVIYIGPNGAALSDKELTDNEGPPDFVPIVPALQKARPAGRLAETGEPAAGAAERDCLKCNTFAELQERLDCIDGSEEPSPFPFEELSAPSGAEQVGKGTAGADKEEDRDGAGRPRAPSPSPTAALAPSPTPASPRSVLGGQPGLAQLTPSPSLRGSRESLGSCGLGEGKPRPVGSPRLGVASLAKASEYRPPGSPSQRCKVYTQKGVLPSAPPPPSSRDPLQPEVRTPPVGMSPQVLKKSASAGSGAFAQAALDAAGWAAPEAGGELLSATTVTLQQPLELNGEDELVFTVVEELTISGVLGRPASAVSFGSDCSVRALASGSRPVSIISSLSEDLERHAGAGPVSEVSITQFLPLPRLGLDARAREARRPSWLGEGGERAHHGFVAQACFGHGEAMAEAGTSECAQDPALSCRQKPPDGVLVLSEGSGAALDEAAALQGCAVAPLGKATVTISNSAGLCGRGGYVPMTTNITLYPCIAVSALGVQEASAPAASPAPTSTRPQEDGDVGAQKETRFEDPWLRREDEVGAGCDAGAGTPKPEAGLERDRKMSPGASPVADSCGRIVDGCEMAVPTPATQGPRGGSLPRAFQKGSRQEALDGLLHGAAEGSAPGPKATTERKAASPKHCVLARPKATPPLPPVRKSSLDQKNRASPQHGAASSPGEAGGKAKDAGGSGRLFSAKLEQLAARSGSLGRAGAGHYACLSLERAESLCSVGARAPAPRDSTVPRAARPAPPASPRAGPARASAVGRLLLGSPRARGLAAAARPLSLSTKSLPQAGQSAPARPAAWATQSLSRTRGPGAAARLPLRALHGRVSELLRGAEAGPPALPSPYSTVTPPRRPQRCSSGHGSDNSSVLSGELPPAMGKTALFYHSGGSSGYESVVRDSEATGSASSAHDSTSEHGAGRCRGLKAPKKRAGAGSQRRRLGPASSLDASSPARKPASSAGGRWVDGPLRSAPRGLAEPFEIKVYEIDDVERLQRRRGPRGKEVVCVNAKLRLLEHRQQRIAEVRAKYEWLRKELEMTKRYLMLDPDKWLSEFDVEQVLELDSLEYLEALECVTERLESRVNFCKAHLMMITCFDITSRRR